MSSGWWLAVAKGPMVSLDALERRESVSTGKEKGHNPCVVVWKSSGRLAVPRPSGPLSVGGLFSKCRLSRPLVVSLTTLARPPGHCYAATSLAASLPKHSSRVLIPWKQRSLFSHLDVSDEPSLWQLLRIETDMLAMTRLRIGWRRLARLSPRVSVERLGITCNL